MKMEARVISILPNILGSQHFSTILDVIREFKPFESNDGDNEHEEILKFLREVAQLGRGS